MFRLQGSRETVLHFFNFVCGLRLRRDLAEILVLDAASTSPVDHSTARGLCCCRRKFPLDSLPLCERQVLAPPLRDGAACRSCSRCGDTQYAKTLCTALDVSQQSPSKPVLHVCVEFCAAWPSRTARLISMPLQNVQCENCAACPVGQTRQGCSGNSPGACVADGGPMPTTTPVAAAGAGGGTSGGTSSGSGGSGGSGAILPPSGDATGAIVAGSVAGSVFLCCLCGGFFVFFYRHRNGPPTPPGTSLSSHARFVLTVRAVSMQGR